MMLHSWIRFAASVVVTAGAVFAQGNFGAITGSVYDSGAAAVPGAQVEAVNLATGLKLATDTTNVGAYLIPNLPSGRYSVTVSAPAFKTFRRQPVVVSTGTTTTVDATLEVGAVTETINVQETTTQVESTTSSVGYVLDEEAYKKLPMDITGMDQGSSGIRQPQQFLFLVPGVTGTAFEHRINGSQSNSQSVQIDGHNYMLINNPGRLVSNPPPFEAIEEFKVNTSQFSAENPVGSAGTQFTFKSGTDRFHGSVFHLLRNQAFNARGFFAREPAPLKLNETALAIGGPVLFPGYNGRQKTHFYFTFTRFSRRGQENAAQLITVPTPAFKQGDFRGWVNATGAMIGIYDPATTAPNGSGGFTRALFPNNTIPSSRFSAVARRAIALMPDPTLAAVQNNYITVAATRENAIGPSLKFDHAFTPNQISRFTFHRFDRLRTIISGYPGILAPDDQSDIPIQQFAISHTSMFGTRIVNEGRFSLGPWTLPWGNQGTYQESGTEVLGIPNTLSTPGVTPRLSIGNLSPVLGNAHRQTQVSERRHFSFGDTLSWVKGRHQFKTGFTAIYSTDDRNSWLNNVGTFNFSNRSTSLPDSPQVGNLGHGFASFLLGEVFDASRLISDVYNHDRMRRIEMFVQDDLKVSRRLTLNIGLNYHIPFAIIDITGQLTGFDPHVPNPGAGGRPGALIFSGEGPGRTGRNNLVDNYFRAFAPRFGFAYALGSNTVVRGGYGIYYGFAPAHTTIDGTSREGYQYTQVEQTLNQGITPAFNIDRGFPVVNVTLPQLDPALKNGSTIDWMHPDGNRPSLTSQWSLGVQKELRGKIFVDVAYVANKASRLPSRLENTNQLAAPYLSLGSLLNQNITSAAAGAAGIRAPYPGFTGTVAQALRAFPQYTSLNNNFQTTGYSSYNSLQIKIERRFAAGLMFLNAYTFSKLIDTGGAARGNGNPLALDTANQRLEKGLASDDQTHTFVTSAIYELPFGPGKRWMSGNKIAGNIVGNWRIASSLRYLSGDPIDITSTQALPLFGGANRPHRIESVPMTGFSGDFDPARDLWLNPAAFVNPAPFTFGSVGRTLPNVRGPAFFNENLSLVKMITPHEGHSIELRVTLLNALNRTVFGGPNTSLGNPNFGRITSQANLPRQLELSLRYTF